MFEESYLVFLPLRRVSSLLNVAPTFPAECGIGIAKMRCAKSSMCGARDKNELRTSFDEKGAFSAMHKGQTRSGNAMTLEASGNERERRIRGLLSLCVQF